jgi:hypothetical protein
VENSAVITKFLEKVKPAEILHRLKSQHGDKSLLHASVYDWYRMFSEGHKEVSNLLNACL